MSKKKTCKPAPKTKKFDGKNYSRSSSATTKAAAKKSAKAHRGKGKAARARVVKNPCGSGFYVYKRG